MKSSAFRLSELEQLSTNQGLAWYEFLKVPDMSAGVYRVGSGTTDRATHEPHDRDEVYVGIRGRGSLTVDGNHYSIESGTVVYVKSGVDHFFHDVEEDLVLLVFFSAAQDARGS